MTLSLSERGRVANAARNANAACRRAQAASDRDAELARRTAKADLLALDPAVQLYRREKPHALARISARASVVLADAKAAFARDLARDERRRHGGRPRKNPVVLKDHTGRFAPSRPTRQSA